MKPIWIACRLIAVILWGSTVGCRREASAPALSPTAPRGAERPSAAMADAVQFLCAALPPAAGGIERVSIAGETNAAMDLFVALVKGTYENADGRRVEITLADLGSPRAQPESLPGFDWLNAQIEKESEASFEKTFREPGCQGYEKYDTASRFGQIKVLVGKRYFAEIYGYNVARSNLHETLKAIKLDGLKK
jgi:hypothetical protein